MLNQYTNQMLGGEDGEALVSLRAGEMRHVCHRRAGPDADIDGQLALRAPEIQEAMNQTTCLCRADARPVGAGVSHHRTQGCDRGGRRSGDPKHANDMRITCSAETR